MSPSPRLSLFRAWLPIPGPARYALVMRRLFSRNLSALLLLMTIGFVLLAELLLFIPSLASFRQEGLERRGRAAALVAESLTGSEAAFGMSREASDMLSMQFMAQTDAEFLATFQDGRTIVILGAPPPGQIAVVTDLRDGSQLSFMATAMEFFASGDAYLRLIAASPVEGHDRLEMLIPCAAIGAELRAYAGRIALLSVLIALFVGALIYFAMLRLIVSPVRKLAAEMTAFREAPEQARRGPAPALTREDEIGQLQREFREMKQSLRAAFRQRERLAGLGLSVTKINHDLRNVLSTALLMADRLSLSDDPQLAEMGERLTRTVERGVGLTEEVLEYSSAREPEPQRERVSLRAVCDEVASDLSTAFPRVRVTRNIPAVFVSADPEQLHRILSNLARNAAEAMVHASTERPQIRFTAESVGETVIVTISDNGPGLPESVEDRLFLPFTRGERDGSTGLGLSISKELAEGMGGSLELMETGPGGTSFILGLAAAKPN